MSCLEGHRHTVVVRCVRFVRLLVLVLLSGLIWLLSCSAVRQMVRKEVSWKVLYILASQRRRMDRLIVLTEHCMQRQSIHVRLGVGLVAVAELISDMRGPILLTSSCQ